MSERVGCLLVSEPRIHASRSPGNAAHSLGMRDRLSPKALLLGMIYRNSRAHFFSFFGFLVTVGWIGCFFCLCICSVGLKRIMTFYWTQKREKRGVRADVNNARILEQLSQGWVVKTIIEKHQGYVVIDRYICQIKQRKGRRRVVKKEGKGKRGFIMKKKKLKIIYDYVLLLLLLLLLWQNSNGCQPVNFA